MTASVEVRSVVTSGQVADRPPGRVGTTSRRCCGMRDGNQLRAERRFSHTRSGPVPEMVKSVVLIARSRSSPIRSPRRDRSRHRVSHDGEHLGCELVVEVSECCLVAVCDRSQRGVASVPLRCWPWASLRDSVRA